MDFARDPEGFTLLEIVVVALLLGLLASLVLPSVDIGGGLRLRNAARELAGDLAYASQRAVTTGREHAWVLDLDAQVFRIEQLVLEEQEAFELPTHVGLLSLSPPESGLDYEPVGNRTGQCRELSEAIAIAELCVAGECHEHGERWIVFSPDGAASPADVYVADSDGYEMQVRVIGFTGEVRIEDVPRD